MLPATDHSVSCEHSRDALGEGACEQLHVQLAQGYGPVVVQSGRARYLGADPDVCVPPVHRRPGAAEDGPVGVDQEPLDGCREGLDEAGGHMVGTRGRSCMKYCWTWAQAPSGTRGTWRLRTVWNPGRSIRRLSYKEGEGWMEIGCRLQGIERTNRA